MNFKEKAYELYAKLAIGLVIAYVVWRTAIIVYIFLYPTLEAKGIKIPQFFP